MSLVLDASLTLSWYFDDERSENADAVLDQVAGHGAYVPSLWRLEVANGLQVAIRRKGLDVAFRDRAFVQLNRMPITLDTDTDVYAWSTTLHLAERFQLTLHDAAYLELAQRRHLPLATLDQPLRVAGGARSIGCLGRPHSHLADTARSDPARQPKQNPRPVRVLRHLGRTGRRPAPPPPAHALSTT